VGKVMAIATTTDGARVDLGIDPGKGYDPIYTDGVVLIRPKSLLGEKYVDLQRGTSNVEIPDGGMLPMSQAFTQVEIDQILNSSDPATRKALSTIAQNDNHLAGLLNNGGDLFSKFNLVFSQQNSDQQIRTSLEQAPPLLSKLNTFLDLTGHDLNSLVPSLLLGQQFNYPNDQLTVTIPAGLQTDKEWDSAFRWFDTGPGGSGIAPKNTFHGFAAMGVQCSSGTPASPAPYVCPGKNAGYGATAASAAPGGSTSPAQTSSATQTTSPTPTFTSADLQRAFLDYLLGQ
jgi:ABC-type transporter Mla subunit MlaD